MNRIIFTPLLDENGEQVVRPVRAGEGYVGFDDNFDVWQLVRPSSDTYPIFIGTEVPLDPPAATGIDIPIVKKIVDALNELKPTSAMGAIELARQLCYWDEVYYLLTHLKKAEDIPSPPVAGEAT